MSRYDKMYFGIDTGNKLSWCSGIGLRGCTLVVFVVGGGWSFTGAQNPVLRMFIASFDFKMEKGKNKE